MNYDNFYPFEYEPLSYNLEELNPYISEYTLYFHHDKHYKNYVDKLNALIERRPMLHNVSLEALTKMSDDNIRTNAGGRLQPRAVLCIAYTRRYGTVRKNDEAYRRQLRLRKGDVERDH